MAKITVLSVDPTLMAEIAPSSSPGALNSLGFVDNIGSKLGLKNGCFYADANEVEQQARIPINISSMDGGEIQIDMNPLGNHPVESFMGGISLILNGVSNQYNGYALILDNNTNTPPVIAVSGVRHIYNATSSPGLSKLRLTLRCIPAGSGNMDVRYTIQDLNNSLALLQSGAVLADSRYPIYNGLPSSGICALSGFYPSWGLTVVSKWDNTGPLNVVDQPYVDWTSKSVIRLVGQIANGGTASYTYAWFYRVGTSGSWSTVGTSNGDTGTSPTLTKHGLVAGTTYQFYRTVYDGITTITSNPITTATAAAGIGSYTVIYVGDSITEGPGSPISINNRVKSVSASLTGLGIQTQGLNFGEGATTSALLTGTYLANVRALALDLKPDCVDCAMGTNDAVNSYSQTTFHDNMDVMASALQTDQTRFVMHCPIYNNTGTLSGPNQALLATGYPTAITQIQTARSNYCYVGDTSAYADFQTNASTYFAVGDIHPNSVGFPALGVDQANRINALLNIWYVASTYTISGPASGIVGNASTSFIITPVGGKYTGTITITPSGCGLSTPFVKTFSNSQAPQTFAITPTGTGVVTLTGSNNGGLTDFNASYVVDPVITTFAFNEVLSGLSTGLTLNGQVLDSAGASVGSVITTGYVEIGNGFYSFSSVVSSGNSLKHYQSGSSSTVLALSKLPQNKPPLGTVVSGSTASSLVVSGLPSGRSYVGQSVYHVSSSESRVVASSSYSSNNYTLGLGSSTGEGGPLTISPTPGDQVLMVP